jgi:hypothetical protein
MKATEAGYVYMVCGARTVDLAFTGSGHFLTMIGIGFSMQCTNSARKTAFKFNVAFDHV